MESVASHSDNTLQKFATEVSPENIFNSLHLHVASMFPIPPQLDLIMP